MKSSNNYNARQDFVLVIVICLAIGSFYRLTLSQFLSSVFSVSLVRVSLHTFLSSAIVPHPSSFIHRHSIHPTHPFVASPSSVYRYLRTTFLRIRVVIVYKIVEPCCTALHAKPKAAKDHRGSCRVKSFAR